MFLSGSVTLTCDNKSHKTTKGINVNKRQIHARGNSERPDCVNDTVKMTP